MSQGEPAPHSSFPLSRLGESSFARAVSRSDRSATWFRLGGELDLAAAPHLKQSLQRATVHSRLTIVDARGLTFMDSAGLCPILTADATARLRGARLVVLRGPAPGPATVQPGHAGPAPVPDRPEDLTDLKTVAADPRLPSTTA